MQVRVAKDHVQFVNLFAEFAESQNLYRIQNGTTLLLLIVYFGLTH
jgi:hypothetical protein